MELQRTEIHEQSLARERIRDKQNREKLRKEHQVWRSKHRSIVNKSEQRYRVRNWSRYLYYSAKQGAKRNNREFNIEVKDVIIPTYCPLLGVKLTFILGKGFQPTNPSIDRIDSTRGYTKDNIHVISRLANTMKLNASKEQLVIFAENILRLYRKVGNK